LVITPKTSKNTIYSILLDTIGISCDTSTNIVVFMTWSEEFIRIAGKLVGFEIVELFGKSEE
jgi:hypothetical protein